MYSMVTIVSNCVFIGSNCVQLVIAYLKVAQKVDLKVLIMDFPGDPVAKNLPANAEDMSSISALEKFHMQGATKPIHHSH